MSYDFDKAERRVTRYYFYLVDADFGAGFLKIWVAGGDDPAHVVRRRRVYRYLRLRHRKLGNASYPLTRIRATKPVKLERH